MADVPLPADGLEGLERRRERKQRNRRIRAGAVAVIVALATGIVFFRSLTSAPIPANPPPVKPPPAAAASGTLAYIVHGDVYVADPDGSNALKIADNRGDDACDGRSDGYSAEGSMWSPDGRYLAYRSCSGGVISDAEGNVVATFPLGGWQIAWSPDSTSVAVWDNFSYGETVSTIGVYGLDGARQAQLTMPPGWTPSGDHDPEWMPDGTSVRVENWELPLDGSTPRPLPSRGGDPYATYSPDGLLVAYSASGSLTVARSDGSEPRQVFDRGAPSSDWGYAWSPTGDRIAFSSGAEVRVLDVVTGSVTLLTEGKRGTSLEVIGFSPKGDRILFSRTEDSKTGETGKSSLWSIGADGSDPRLVVAGTWEGEWLSR